MKETSKNCKKVESVYEHPVTGEKEKMTVQVCFTNQEKEDITKMLGTSFDEIITCKLNEQMRTQIEQREYDDLLNYCKDNGRYKKVTVSNEHCINDIIKSFIDTIELYSNTAMIGSVCLMNDIIRPAFKYINSCKVDDNIESRLLQFNYSFATCKLSRTNDYGQEYTNEINLWIRPYLKYDDCTLLIINQNDKYFSECIEFDFEDISTVSEKLCRPLC